VFVFLESVGCRWYFPDPVWTVIPHKPSLSARVNRMEQPSYVFRRIWYGWDARTPKLQEDYRAWSRHNLLAWNGSPLPPPFQIDTSHSYTRHVPRELFKDHPEWFALVDGKRQPRQLCISNKTVQDMVIASVLKTFRANSNLTMVSVDPDDGGDHCECDQCKALGTTSDQVFHLANLVADAVRNEFPEKWVGLNAYSLHSDPPTHPIHPGVFVCVTTRFRNTDLSFEEQLGRFKKLGATAGVYEYFSEYAWDWDMPGAALAGRASMLGDLLHHYRHDLNVTSLDAESSCNWGPNGLGYWVAAKMLWNPNQKTGELTRDFYTNAFGKAAAPMQRLYERWNSGDWFVIRQGVKLALQDLAEAYRMEDDPAVKIRLDRIAMYVHWLRLNEDYVESVIFDKSEDVIPCAREMIVYSRRIMDTGLVHVFPMLFEKTWFENRFSTLKTIKSFDWKQAEAWKTERTDVPLPSEVANNFTSDLKKYQDVKPVEVQRRVFSQNLVPIQDILPGTVKEWGAVERSGLAVTTGEYMFRAKKGEKVDLSYRLPVGNAVNGGTTIHAHWKLRRPGENRYLSEGRASSSNNQPATCEVKIPATGVFVIVPGQSETSLSAAEVSVGTGPQAAFAGRYWDYVNAHIVHDEFTLWKPTLNRPLYFFVPKGTRQFVIGIDATQVYSRLVLKTADGQVTYENDKVQMGSSSYRLFGERVAVPVPPGTEGRIWSLALASYLCRLELYDIPPYVALHPSELLVPGGVMR